MREEIVDYTCTQKIPKPTQAQDTAVLTYSTPLREIDIQLAGKKEEVDLLDGGSEIVVAWKDIWGFKVDPVIKTMMKTVNGGKEQMLGCTENPEIEVDGLVHVFVVPQAPSKLQPWQTSVHLSKAEDHNGNNTITVHDYRHRT